MHAFKHLNGHNNKAINATDSELLVRALQRAGFVDLSLPWTIDDIRALALGDNVLLVYPQQGLTGANPTSI